MNLFLDCESTGLIPKDYQWRTDYARFPRIVSLAWRIITDKGPVDQSYIINQGGRNIPEGAIRVHGITDEICSESPYFIQEVLIKLSNYLILADKIIGHNLYFDSALIKANALREFGEASQIIKKIVDGLDKYKRIDIMRKSATFNKGYITLAKLHQKLFNESFKAHDAMEDVKALERCYYELVRINALK